MRKRFQSAYLIFSIVVLTAATAWTAYRIYATVQDGVERIVRAVDVLENRITSYYLARGSFASEIFTGRIAEEAERHPGILVFWVSTPGTGVEYLYAVDDSLVNGYPDSIGAGESDPEVIIHPLFDRRFDSAFTIPGVGTKNLSIVFRILPREDLFRYLRDMLIILAGFVLMTLVVLLAASASGTRQPLRPDAEPREETSPETEPTPSGSHSNGLFSPRTKLTWFVYLEEKLTLELKRAASFDQDLALLLFACDRGLDDTDYLKIAGMIVDFFNFQDLCFEYRDSSYAVIIPNIDLDGAIGKAEAFRKRLETKGHGSCPLSFGLSSRNGRLMSGSRLMREADNALRKALPDPGEIIAFRVDPQKYRSYIANQTRKSS